LDAMDHARSTVCGSTAYGMGAGESGGLRPKYGSGLDEARCASDGKIPFTWVGRERRFSSVDVENMKRGSDCSTFRPRLELLYVRVSGSSGQESSLEAQEAELRATSTGEVVKVVRDRGSGLKENRPGPGCWRWSRTAR
ncbi:recombinase family protein, partial [Streptomyces gibsoniae]